MYRSTREINRSNVVYINGQPFHTSSYDGLIEQIVSVARESFENLRIAKC